MQTIVELPVTTRAIDVYSPPDNQERLLIWQHTEEEGVFSQIGKPRRAILEALSTFYYLTADQLTRLLFSPTLYTYVNKHLQFLVKEELVEKILPAKQILYGRAPYVYTLNRKERNLKASGFRSASATTRQQRASIKPIR